MLDSNITQYQETIYKLKAEAEALKLDKQQKYFPHYVEQLKE